MVIKEKERLVSEGNSRCAEVAKRLLSAEASHENNLQKLRQEASDRIFFAQQEMTGLKAKHTHEVAELVIKQTEQAEQLQLEIRTSREESSKRQRLYQVSGDQWKTHIKFLDSALIDFIRKSKEDDEGSKDLATIASQLERVEQDMDKLHSVYREIILGILKKTRVIVANTDRAIYEQSDQHHEATRAISANHEAELSSAKAEFKSRLESRLPILQ